MKDRKVTTSQASNFAKNNSMMYVETSAKTGENVNEVNYSLLDLLLNRSEDC